MDTTSHYALLYAINHYPGLERDLYGPENDACAIRDWLIDPDGGRLDPAHVRLILSSDYPYADDPFQAAPDETHFIKVLKEWLQVGGEWRPEGFAERLYLFFAGHGFATGNNDFDPGLYTAKAQLDVTLSIPVMRYVDRLANAGFFREIVVLVDCCQSLLKSLNLNDPALKLPDRLAGSRVKRLIGIATPRGYEAFEEQKNSEVVHGFFTKVFLDSLRVTKPVRGWITARKLEESIEKIWELRYPSLPKPILQAPLKMNIFPASKTKAKAMTGVAKDMFQDKERAPASELETRGHGCVSLSSEPPQPPQLRSSLPAEWSASFVFPQAWSAQTLLYRAIANPPASNEALLLLFARDSGHLPGSSPWRMNDPLRTALRLCRIDVADSKDCNISAVDLELIVDAKLGCVSVLRPLPPGSYLLSAGQQLRNRWVWDSMVLHLANGWRTEVWLDAAQSADGSSFSLDSALVRVLRPQQQPSESLGDSSQEIEQLRSALAGHHPLAAPVRLLRVRESNHAKSEIDPMRLLLELALLARDRDRTNNGHQPDQSSDGTGAPSNHSIHEAISWLELHWSSTSADLIALRQQLIGGATQLTSSWPPGSAPMLSICWHWLTDPDANPQLPLTLQRLLGWWRVASSPWLQIQKSELVGEGKSDGGDDTQKSLAQQTHLSQLQYALQIALLQEPVEPDPTWRERMIEGLARSAELNPASVRQALEELEAMEPSP